LSDDQTVSCGGDNLVRDDIRLIDLNDALDLRDDFEEFEALEFLSLGIRGKLSLWNALRVCSASDSRLASLDLSYLIVRAEDQYARVEERRLSLAAAALKET
jgi:hypothetical protein